MARNVLDPTQRASLGQTALKDLQELIQTGITNKRNLQVQSDKNKLDRDKFNLAVEKESTRKREELVKEKQSDTKLFIDTFYEPIISATTEGTLKDVYTAETMLGYNTEDGPSKYDTMFSNMVPLGDKNNYLSTKELSELLNNRKVFLRKKQKLERDLVSSRVSPDEKSEIMSDVWDMADKGELTDTEVDEYITRAQRQGVPTYRISKDETNKITPAGAATNFTGAADAWRFYSKDYTPSSYNMDQFVSSQDDADALIRGTQDSNLGTVENTKKAIKERFNIASTEKANNLFLDLTVSEQSAKTFNAFSGDENAQSRMIANYGGLALESILALKQVNSKNYIAYLEDPANKETKDELIEKLTIALGPYENWKKYFENTAKYPLAKFKVINE